ncbi:MAG: MFS transporter [Deltaproteobacteria bacterium]|nr:MFS transporter [Deltaproteobacteria bacterium]
MFYGWYIVGACVVISMYFSGTIHIGFTTIVEPIAREMGWTYTQISLAVSMRGLETGLLVPVAGFIIDRWGPRSLLFGGSFFTGIGLLLLSRVHSLTMFYVSFAIICIGMSALPSGLLMSAVANWFRKHESLAMGITASGVSLGGILIPFVTAIVDNYGWRHSVFIIGLGAWLIPMPLSLMLRHKPEKYGYLPDGDSLPDTENKKNPVSEKRLMPHMNTKQAMSTFSFWILSLGCLGIMMTTNAVLTHIMPFFSTIGVERSLSRFIISAVPIIGIIGRVGFGWIGDRIDKVKIATLALSLNSLGVWILFFITGDRLWLSIFFIVLFGIGWGGFVPMQSGLVIKFFGRDHMGTIIGFINSIMMVGMMTGAPLTGWIYDMRGSYKAAWFIMGSMLAIITIIFFAALRRFDKKEVL